MLLLLAAAFAVAAVFAVHRIEAAGGPLSEPYATRAYAPGGDKRAIIRFSTHRMERVTLYVVDAHGRRVRTLLDDERVDGPRIEHWDGRDDHGAIVRDGTYEAQLTRRGDDRVYEPAHPIVIDTTPPRGRLDAWSLSDGVLRGIALLEPGVHLRAELRDGRQLVRLHAWKPSPGSRSAQVTGPHPAGTDAVRFATRVDADVTLDDIRLFAVDLAGNERRLR
jgi:hypothetical protein